MKIKDMFWKLFWLMLRGKGNTRILFDSEATCFKEPMIEVIKANFNLDEGGGLGEDLSLDQYLKIISDTDDFKETDLADLLKPEVDKYLDSKPEMTENDLKELEKL